MNAFSPPNSAHADTALAYLPIFVGIKGHTALLIGGGEAALAKLNLLRRAGARVRLVARHLDTAINRSVAEDRMVVWINEPLAACHFEGLVLAIDASGDDAINRVSVRLAHAADVQINVVDRPALCDFIMPAILDRSPVVVAVSTGGLAPAVARLIRQRLEVAVPAGFGRVAMLAARFRRLVSERLQSPMQRADFWEQLFDGPAAALALAGQMQGAEAVVHALIEQGAQGRSSSGAVHVLPIGSADPDLLTVRAARLIRMADLIVHETAVGQGILELARRDAVKIEIRPDHGPASTRRREALGSLNEFARRGGMSVYLKAETLQPPMTSELMRRSPETSMNCGRPHRLAPAESAMNGSRSLGHR